MRRAKRMGIDNIPDESRLCRTSGADAHTDDADGYELEVTIGSD